jgi:uncharacterized protein DUF6456
MRGRAKKARRALTPSVDHGPAERAQHGELVTRETMVAGITGKRVKHECRLDWYWDKGSIIDRQYEAGLRFRRDWHFAASAPSVVGTYGARISRLAGRQDFTDTQLAARRRTAAAIALLGRELAAIVVDVCCFDNWASGRLPALRDGLRMLADHYGLARHARE